METQDFIVRDYVDGSGEKQIAHIFNGDITRKELGDFQYTGLAAVDIETTGPDRASLLDPQRGYPAIVTLKAWGYYPCIVRINPKRRPNVLCSLLSDTMVVKVFHHAPFDLSFMMHAWNVTPIDVRCTRMAAKFLGFTSDQRSLAPQVKNFLGIDLAKGQALSDWTAEQLTADQIRYAVEDVLYLEDLYNGQSDAMVKRDADGFKRYLRMCDFLPTYVWHKLHDMNPLDWYER